MRVLCTYSMDSISFTHYHNYTKDLWSRHVAHWSNLPSSPSIKKNIICCNTSIIKNVLKPPSSILPFLRKSWPKQVFGWHTSLTHVISPSVKQQVLMSVSLSRLTSVHWSRIYLLTLSEKHPTLNLQDKNHTHIHECTHTHTQMHTPTREHMCTHAHTQANKTKNKHAQASPALNFWTQCKLHSLHTLP